MSTSIQSLQNNQFAQNPNPPPKQQPPQQPPQQIPQQDKKVTFQQPPTQMNGPNPRMPHRQAKQETQLPHPSGMSIPSHTSNNETSKGLKIPPQQVTSDNNNLQEHLKEMGVVVVLAMLLFSTIVQDCVMNIIPNGSYDGKATLVTSMLTSLFLGCAFFLVKKFLL